MSGANARRSACYLSLTRPTPASSCNLPPFQHCYLPTRVYRSATGGIAALKAASQDWAYTEESRGIDVYYHFKIFQRVFVKKAMLARYGAGAFAGGLSIWARAFSPPFYPAPLFSSTLPSRPPLLPPFPSSTLPSLSVVAEIINGNMDKTNKDQGGRGSEIPSDGLKKFSKNVVGECRCARPPPLFRSPSMFACQPLYHQLPIAPTPSPYPHRIYIFTALPRPVPPPPPLLALAGNAIAFPTTGTAALASPWAAECRVQFLQAHLPMTGTEGAANGYAYGLTARTTAMASMSVFRSSEEKRWSTTDGAVLTGDLNFRVDETVGEQLTRKLGEANPGGVPSGATGYSGWFETGLPSYYTCRFTEKAGLKATVAADYDECRLGIDAKFAIPAAEQLAVTTATTWVARKATGSPYLARHTACEYGAVVPTLHTLCHTLSQLLPAQVQRQ